MGVARKRKNSTISCAPFYCEVRSGNCDYPLWKLRNRRTAGGSFHELAILESIIIARGLETDRRGESFHDLLEFILQKEFSLPKALVCGTTGYMYGNDSYKCLFRREDLAVLDKLNLWQIFLSHICLRYFRSEAASLIPDFNAGLLTWFLRRLVDRIFCGRDACPKETPPEQNYLRKIKMCFGSPGGPKGASSLEPCSAEVIVYSDESWWKEGFCQEFPCLKSW